MKIYTSVHAFNADRYTPINLFLSLRNTHRFPCLLESNDYADPALSKSIIGLDPLLQLKLQNNELEVTDANQETINYIKESKQSKLYPILEEIIDSITFQDTFDTNGLFGRIGFESYRLTHDLQPEFKSRIDIPDIHLLIYTYLIVIDPITSTGYLVKNNLNQESILSKQEINTLLSNKPCTNLPFEASGEEEEELDESDFIQLIETAKSACVQGDVFQLVLSNAYKQRFVGDDFAIYRKLRQLNPSPYLFYFDFEEYRLLGSSPEAQLKYRNEKAEIHPIAGTVKRSQSIEDNQRAINFLKSEPKEQAEHVMLVDLARNDLSQYSNDVRVEVFQEVQAFSHVFHLVSKVSGRVDQKNQTKLLFESFPAGTLSGTPKHRALEYINTLEASERTYYGGAIGYFYPKHSINMAIVIRSILSKNNTLHYRAGAGIVIDSNPASEYQEVQHKLRAIRTAINHASTFNHD